MHIDNFLDFTLANEHGLDIYHREELSNGTLVEIWDSGVIVFTPQQPNQRDLVLSSAVHGDETAPIEICAELIEALRRGELTSRCRVMFLLANPAAVNLGRRFVAENMNRLFSGAHSQGPGLVNQERERAKALESYMGRFFTEAPDGPREKLHYDMHTAIRDSEHEKFAIYPYQHGAPYKKRQLQLLRALDVPVVLLHDGPTTTFSYYSVNSHKADAFTVELGKVRPFGQNDMSRFVQTKATLRALLTEDEPELPTFNPDDHTIYQVERSINRTQEDFSLNFPDNQANFTCFPVGQELARDGGQHYYVEQEGEAIVFPNAKVALGQRALLTVTPVRAEQLSLI